MMTIRQPKHVAQKRVAEQAVGIVLEHHGPNQVDLVSIDLGREEKRKDINAFDFIISCFYFCQSLLFPLPASLPYLLDIICQTRHPATVPLGPVRLREGPVLLASHLAPAREDSLEVFFPACEESK
jgi:hypothetical protein